MGTSIESALQKALYDKLTGDATLMALISGVFDRVPQGQAFPYLTVGDGTVKDWSTYGAHGQDATAAVHAWSRKGGRKEAQTILSRVHELLHGGTLTIAGWGLVGVTFEFGETFPDPDGITYHGVHRYRILAMEN